MSDSDVTERLRRDLTNIFADHFGGEDYVGTTDQKITDEIIRQGLRLPSGRHSYTLYLGPADHTHPDDIGEYTTSYVVTDGDPVLHFEIRTGSTQQQFFLCKIGPQDALDKVPFAPFNNTYRLEDRIFCENDVFRTKYAETAAYYAYSLYTELCMALKPESIFEIGIRYGYSAWAMLRGCAPGTIYHGIDIRTPEYASWMLHREYPNMQLRLARGDSGTLTHLSRTYDLAYVDGNHSHQGALHDLKLCFGRAKYILVDDVTAFATVNSAVNEFLTRYPDVPAARYDTMTGHVLIGPLPYLQNG